MRGVVVAIAILVVFAGVFGVSMIAFHPIGKALADRIRGRSLPAGDVAELQAEVAALREQVSELAERQDFTERMLAQARDKGLLGAGQPPS